MPHDLETVVSLALLQEEIGEDSDNSPSFNKHLNSYRSNSKAMMATTPPVQNRMKHIKTSEDKRGTDSARSSTSAQKLAALKAYRRAMGLCFKCGEKWNPQHQCAPTFQLHVVEELLELFESPDSPESFTTTVNDEAEVDQELLALSQQALSGIESNSCFRLQGVIQDQEVLILIDSGSSGKFVSSLLADKLHGVEQLPTAVKVKIANSEILLGTTGLPNCPWKCQGAEFLTDLKIIPLNCYDMILGMEWLKTQSPMKVDWDAKWMVVNQKEGKKILYGIQANTTSCLPASSAQLQMFEQVDAVLYLVQVLVVEETPVKSIPTVVQQLIKKYSSLFDEPNGLPPK